MLFDSELWIWGARGGELLPVSMAFHLTEAAVQGWLAGIEECDLTEQH